MAQVFSHHANTIARVSLFGLATVVALGWWIGSAIHTSAWVTRVDVPRSQPVPFSHKHHVSGLGLDCRYCHTGVEQSNFAGIPPTKTCMTCHSQIWTNAPVLQPVRESWRTDRPIQWQRVHDLPDYVYFNHSIHVAKGIGCNTCHGQIDQMPITYKIASLHMQWCLYCHRNPEKFVRPKDQVFNMSYQNPGPKEQAELGKKLVAAYHIDKDRITNCSTCHR
jgi:hypothetical protein